MPCAFVSNPIDTHALSPLGGCTGTDPSDPAISGPGTVLIPSIAGVSIAGCESIEYLAPCDGPHFVLIVAGVDWMSFIG